MRAVLLLATHELRLRTRDPLGLFWMAGFPLLMALLFAAVAGSVERPTLDVVVVEDGSPSTARLRARLAAVESLRVTSATPERAEALVRRGERIAWLRAEDGGVELGVDPSRPLERDYLRMVAGAGRSPSGTAVPVRVVQIDAQEPTPFATALPIGMLWAVIGCSATFSIALVAERTRGTHVRLRAVPLRTSQLVASKALACLLAELAVVATLLVIGVGLFDVRIERPATLGAATSSLAVAFAGLTVALGALGRTENGVAGAGWSTHLMLAMLGGAMIPKSVMPSWIAELGVVSPVRWGVTALEAGLWRDLPVHAVGGQCVALAVLGAAGLALGTGLTARRER